MLGHEIKAGIKLKRIIPQKHPSHYNNSKGFAELGDIITVDVACEWPYKTEESGHHGILYKLDGHSPVFDCVYKEDPYAMELIPAWEIVE